MRTSRRALTGALAAVLFAVVIVAVTLLIAAQVEDRTSVGTVAGVSPTAGRLQQAADANSSEISRNAIPSRGFLVWESNRTGSWRLWRRELDRTGVRRLTPQEDALQHCCAHISPDGTEIAYLRYPSSERQKGRESPTAALHLMQADGSGDRILAAEVRLPSESRSVVWRSAHELIYVDGGGHSQLLDLSTGERRPLTRRPHPLHGWLINATLSYATTDLVDFSPYDAASRVISERRPYGGCQPYFSHDGRWGFWMSGAGGPISRIDLATGQISTLLRKNDPVMPGSQGYLYFPMLSRCGQLLAFGASANEHNFARSNYDIFVVETDPRTLELLGAPVRLTRHPASDRFPDVFLEPLELGRRFGEAPLRVRWATPEMEGIWRWDFGDGTTVSSAGGEHEYPTPGDFMVRAEQNGRTRLGRITVAAAQVPRLARVELRRGSEVHLAFDEEVNLENLRLALASGAAVRRWERGRDGRSLVVVLQDPVVEEDRLVVNGVADRAQRPNAMPPQEVALEPPFWPTRDQGLVFLWETADSPNLIYDSALSTERTFPLQPRGRARLDRSFAMQVAEGFFIANEEAASHIAESVKRTNELTLELTLSSLGAPAERSYIVTFSGANPPKNENFALYAMDDSLYLSLRGESTRIGPLPGPGPRHLTLTYLPGRLSAYLEGRQILQSDALNSDFFRWSARPLIFGAGFEGEGDWAGTLEGIAIYDRVLSAEEVAENARRYGTQLAQRPEVAELRLTATLGRRSRTPTLEEIAPYREALMVFEYEVTRVVAGELEDRTVRVAHWAILDGEPQSVTRREVGERYSLRLEPFDANPQLEGLFMADTLPERFDLELYYQVEP